MELSTPDLNDIKSRSLSDIILLYNTQGKALHYDPQQLRDQLGFSTALTVSDDFDFLSVLHAADLKLFQVFLSGVAEGDDMPELNCRFKCIAGEYHTYRLRAIRQDATTAVIEAFAIPAADHTIHEIIGFRQLKQATEDVLQYGTYEYDLANNIGHWSDGMYALFGYEQERPVVTFEFFLSHVVSADAEKDVNNMLRSFPQHATYSEEFDILTRDKVLKRIHLVGKRLYDNTGKVYKRVGIIRDITKQKKQEATISKIIDELQRSNKELEEFAYVASHDLQEPLRKIATFCGRLSEKFSGNLNDEGKLYLDRVMASADNMRILIDNLLEFSRVSRMNAGFSEVSLDFVLQQVEHELELIMEETSATIIATELPTIRGSFSGMKQVFNNIINNAIKFRKPGVAPSITIDARDLTDQEVSEYKLTRTEGRYFKISICDNGIGFEPEYATRIFQIFQRLHGRSEYPGSGIGLAICKKIIDHHNGIIWAENIPERGACFNIILPEYPNKS